MAHNPEDLDGGYASYHHSLGIGPTQAAPGNHRHKYYIKTVNNQGPDENGNVTVSTGPGGTSDHGALEGLLDDDHPQYLTQARGDARYSVITHAHANYALVGHNHDGTYAPVHDHPYASLTHNHNGDYSPIGHNHDTDYSPIGHTHDFTHNHDTDYAPLVHNHDGIYSPVGHTHPYSPDNHNHDTDYASLTHNHDGIYAPVHNHPYAPLVHNHDGDYAPADHTHDFSHNHDGIYAPIHDHPYAPLVHNHDGNYAPIVHSHSQYVLLSGGTMTGDLTVVHPPTANGHATSKKYVDDAISGAIGSIQNDLNYCGTYDANENWVDNPSAYGSSKGYVSLDSLPPADPDNSGDYFIVNANGYTGLPAQPPFNLGDDEITQFGDWVISDGDEWLVLRYSAQDTIARDVAIDPVNDLYASNVQEALQELDDNKVNRSGDTMAGTLDTTAGIVVPVNPPSDLVEGALYADLNEGEVRAFDGAGDPTPLHEKKLPTATNPGWLFAATSNEDVREWVSAAVHSAEHDAHNDTRFSALGHGHNYIQPDVPTNPKFGDVWYDTDAKDSDNRWMGKMGEDSLENDLNFITKPGFYSVGAAYQSNCPAAGDWHLVVRISSTRFRVHQTAYPFDNDANYAYTRTRNSAGTWTAWRPIDEPYQEPAHRVGELLGILDSNNGSGSGVSLNTSATLIGSSAGASVTIPTGFTGTFVWNINSYALCASASTGTVLLWPEYSKDGGAWTMIPSSSAWGAVAYKAAFPQNVRQPMSANGHAVNMGAGSYEARLVGTRSDSYVHTVYLSRLTLQVFISGVVQYVPYL